VHQSVSLEGATAIVARQGKIERHKFASAAEAAARTRFVAEALTWIGTPFRDCADVKGGAVDCAMLMVRSAVDTGLIPPFDPRPYSPRWMLHRSEEKFLAIVRDRLGAKETDTPRFGDVHLYQFGRCYSHGGIRINAHEIVHAYGAAGCCLVSRIDEPLLNFIGHGDANVPRPVKYFDIASCFEASLARCTSA
jgi:cell wall-associated NlpC family hydrolase